MARRNARIPGMRAMTTITPLSDPENLSATQEVVSFYGDFISRLRSSREDFFLKLLTTLSDINVSENIDVRDLIESEFIHRGWKFDCTLEGRQYNCEASLDVLQNQNSGSGESGIVFYWAACVNMYNIEDLGADTFIQVKIGPYFSDEAEKLLLCGAVILMESTMKKLSNLINPNRDDESEVGNEIIEEVGCVVEGLVDEMVNPYANEEEEEDEPNEEARGLQRQTTH